MKKLLTVLLFLTLAPGCAPAPAPTPGAVTLIPLADEAYGIQTLVPDGWQARASGVVWRKQSTTDLTLIVQQSALLSADALLTSLLPRLHLTQAPDPVGTHQGGALEWTLYRVDVSMMASEVTVDLALAQAGGRSYFVFLQTPPQEHDALYESIFIPTLDAFSPLEAAETPVPYRVEAVTFSNGEVELAGTLTLPGTGGPYPAVVLVTGSGRQDRDDSMRGIPMKPFRLIADTLTRLGIAVLRYDDRGVGESTGNFETATLSDFASDAEAALDYLLARGEIDGDRLGMLGHSEGGLVAAMLGARNDDLDFIILMAGPGLDGRDLLMLQTRRRMEVAGATPAEIEAELAFVEALAAAVEDRAAMESLAYQRTLAQVNAMPEEQRLALGDVDRYARAVAQQTAQEYSAGWFKSFLDYDPAPDWARISAPVLALFGGKDVQVDAAQNAPALEHALKQGANPDYTIITLPEANHLFQTAGTGSFSEYGSLPAEFTPGFLPALVDWLEAHLRIAA